MARPSPGWDGNGTTSQANNERVGIEKEEAGQISSTTCSTIQAYAVLRFLAPKLHVL